MGGREHVQAIYDRVGDGGHIVIHSPLDSEEEVIFLFQQAQIFNSDPILRRAEEVQQAFSDTHRQTSPSMVFADLDGDGDNDVASYRYLPEYFENNEIGFPGDPNLVRDFVTGHELGHESHNSHLGERTFWQRWQNERNADQDGFRGMGDDATVEFQRGILAARAGNMLPYMFDHTIGYGTPHVSHNANHAFIHASVLGIFLPGEVPYEITEEGLNASLTDFRATVAGRIHDNYARQNPDFELDVSSMSDPATRISIYKGATTLNAFLEQQPPDIAARYEQFGQNMSDLSEQIGKFENMYRTTSGNEAMGHYIDLNIQALENEMRSEFQQALNFMQDTDPALLQRYLAEHHPEIILEQTASEMGTLHVMDTAQMAQIVMQLRDEGAFDDDPIQRRLVDYIEIDMETRPHHYAPQEPSENEVTLRNMLVSSLDEMKP